MAALLARIRADGPPLRGVVHSAGVLADAGLLQQDADRFARVFAPKVQGGHLLDTLTRSDPLDFFVLFSSVAAVLGSRGQANHSAANAFLDLLARERHSRGLPGLSINWGAWTDVGAAADRGMTERIAAQGLGSVTPSQGLLAMERLLALGCAQAAVLPIDWKRYFEQAARTVRRQRSWPTWRARPRPSRRLRKIRRGQVDSAASRSFPPRPGVAAPLVAAFVREQALRALGRGPVAQRSTRARRWVSSGSTRCSPWSCATRWARLLGHTLPATLAVRLPDARRADRLHPRPRFWP